jgi:hypothetical protein
MKLTWDQPVPKALVARLLRARVRDHEAGNTSWSDAPSRAAKKASAKKAPAKKARAKKETK